MSGNKRKLLFVLIPVLLIVILLAVIFWDTIMIYAAPNVVLTRALNETVSQLDTRFLKNPFRNVINIYNREGKYTVNTDLVTDHKLLGEVSFDMTVQTAFSEHQALADGNVYFSGKDLDLALYLNDEFLALSSEDLLQGTYYGITYDTFQEDITGFPLIGNILPDKTVQKWDESLSDIQEFMSRPSELPPEISDEDLKMVMTAILLLDSQVSSEDLSTASGSYDCHVVTYSASGEEVRSILGKLMDVSDAADAQISAAFYLHENSVLKVALSGSAGSNHFHYTLMLGEEPISDPLILTGERTENGQNSSFSLTVETSLAESHYQETIDWKQNTDGTESTRILSYDWNTANGDMLLSYNDSMPIRLNLTQNDAGILVKTDDFSQLMALLMKKEEGSTVSASCTMLISRNAEITAPEFKNLDAWSLNDFYTLLSGLGSLIGLDLPQ